MFNNRGARSLSQAVITFICLTVVTIGCGCQSEKQPAYLNKFQVQKSPDGKYEATLYNYGEESDGYLGATVSTSLYANVRPTTASFDPKKDQVFEMRHGYKVQFVWKAKNRLLIKYPGDADVYKKIRNTGNLSIEYKRDYHL